MAPTLKPVCLLLLSFIGLQNVLALRCSEDYSPCTCDEGSSGDWYVSCEGVSLVEIVQVFQKTNRSDIQSLLLLFSLNDSSVTVPAELLGGKRIYGSLTLACPDPSFRLKIDPNAFASSNELVRSVTIQGCDFSEQPDLNFMASFNLLTTISIYNAYNFNSFSGIPSHSYVYYVAIAGCRGFNLLDEANVSLTGLQVLHLYNNQLTDDEVERVLNSLAGSSLDSLRELRLYDNQLTTMPKLIPSFSRLTQLMMERNSLKVLTSDSIAFLPNNSLSYLHLGANFIETVEPGAFAGNFQNVYLQQNRLTRFESDAFKPLLESIETTVYGRLSLFANQIVCDCHLAWLIRDNRHLLDYVEGGRCANSTAFEELIPEGFNDCLAQTAAFSCPSKDGNYAGSEKCSDLFYTCSNGTPYKMYCPSGLVYNPELELCDWPSAASGC